MGCFVQTIIIAFEFLLEEVVDSIHMISEEILYFIPS